MKIPTMLIPTIIGLLSGVVFWLLIGFSLRVSLVLGVLVGFIAGFVETGSKGQD